MSYLSRRGFMGLISALPFASLFIADAGADTLKPESAKPDMNQGGNRMFIVHFIHGTNFEYGAKVISNHPFIASRGESVSVRLVRSSRIQHSIERAEIFVSERAVTRMPKFFVGEIKALSPRIYRVERRV